MASGKCAFLDLAASVLNGRDNANREDFSRSLCMARKR